MTQVLLVGSLSTGSYSPHSEADMLPVLAEDRHRRMIRTTEFSLRFLPAGCPIDVPADADQGRKPVFKSQDDKSDSKPSMFYGSDVDRSWGLGFALRPTGERRQGRLRSNRTRGRGRAGI